MTYAHLICSDHLWVLFPDVVMVLASEFTVDVVKHAFITKFNDISADVSSPPISAGGRFIPADKSPLDLKLHKICPMDKSCLFITQQNQPSMKGSTPLAPVKQNAHKP